MILSLVNIDILFAKFSDFQLNLCDLFNFFCRYSNRYFLKHRSFIKSITQKLEKWTKTESDSCGYEVRAMNRIANISKGISTSSAIAVLKVFYFIVRVCFKKLHSIGLLAFEFNGSLYIRVQNIFSEVIHENSVISSNSRRIWVVL